MKKIVCVVEENQLFSTAIQNLLSAQKNLTVHGGSLSAFSEALETDPSFKPDLMVVVQPSSDPCILALNAFIKRFPTIRVVLINLQNNQIEVFDKQMHELKQLSDFLSVI